MLLGHSVRTSLHLLRVGPLDLPQVRVCCPGLLQVRHARPIQISCLDLQSGAKLLRHVLCNSATRSPWAMLRGKIVLQRLHSQLAPTLRGGRGGNS